MIENNLRWQLSPHSNRSYETSPRKIRDLKIRRWQQQMQRMTSKKKKEKKRNNHRSWPRSHGSGHFWNRIFCYPDWRWQRPKPLWNEVSSGCCFGGRFHCFRVKADSFRKSVVSKISGLEWTWPNNQNNNSARASCFLYIIFVVTVRLRRSIKMTIISRFMEDVKVQKVMLHGEGTTICDDFQWDTALQHCCNRVLNSWNIDPTLQRWTCVAFKIVVENSLVEHHLKQKDDEIFFLFWTWIFFLGIHLQESLPTFELQ